MSKPTTTRQFSPATGRRRDFSMLIAVLVAFLILVIPVGAAAEVPVTVTLTPSQSTVWIGDSVEVVLRVAIRIPGSTPSGLEPLNPRDPPHLDIPYFEPQNPPGMRGPDMRVRLQPWLTIDREQPAFLINDYGVWNGGSERKEPSRFQPDREWRAHDGQRWIEYVIRASWTAEKEGRHVFEPATFRGQVAVEADAEGRFTAWQTVGITSTATRVNALNLPAEFWPADFFGAVGTVMSADAGIEPQTCRLGDPLLLRLRIGGDVLGDRLRPPRLSRKANLEDTFRIQDETVRTVRHDDWVEFQYVLRPMAAGNLEFPGLQLSWYNLSTRIFTNYVTAPLPLRILEARRPEIEDWSLTSERENVRRAGAPDETPAPLRRDPDGWQRVTWRKDRVFMILAAAGPAQYLLLSWGLYPPALRRRTRRRYRRLTAILRLRRRLRRIMRAPASSPAISARAVRAIVNCYCADALGMEVSGPPTADLWRVAAGDYPAIMPSSRCRELLERCDRQCYAPDSAEPFDPIADARALLAEFCRARSMPFQLPLPGGSSEEKHSADYRLLACRLTAVGLLGMLLTAWRLQPAPAYDSLTRQHLWEEANFAAARAVEPRDFTAARKRYEALIDAGAHNGSLYYNHGTVCLAAGDPSAAGVALRRAARLTGMAGDVRHNLRLSLRQSAAGPNPALFGGDRVINLTMNRPWLSDRTLGRIGSLAMLAVWIFLTIRMVAKHPRLRTA